MRRTRIPWYDIAAVVCITFLLAALVTVVLLFLSGPFLSGG